MNIRDRIKQKLKSHDINGSFNFIDKMFENNKDKFNDEYNEYIVLRARHHQNQKNLSAGRLNKSEADKEFANIITSILSVIDGYPEELINMDGVLEQKNNLLTNKIIFDYEIVRDKILKVFPFSGVTKIVYTCRGYFENPQFECPLKEDKLAQSRTVYSHVPVDEMETYSLLFSWFSQTILGTSEEQIHTSSACSQHVLKFSENDYFKFQENGQIDNFLLNNIIVIGENSFSNYLTHLYKFYLPWRHYALELLEKPFGFSLHKKNFSVQPIFYDKIGHNLFQPYDLVDLNNLNANCAIVSFFPNPFAPNKWILLLIGCRRPGQYLLLSWLKSEQAKMVFQQLIEFKGNEELKYFQIVIRGVSHTSIQFGEFSRSWEMSELKSLNGQLPFFASKRLVVPALKKGNDMGDLSLLALVDKNDPLIKEIERSLPASISRLFDVEAENEGIGFHVTLYEFIHSEGYKDHGLIDKIMERKNRFIEILYENINKHPHINIRLRQTRLTPYSLQVLVDVYMEFEDDFHLQSILEEHPEMPCAMDLINDASFSARLSLSEEEQLAFNYNRIPFPLHLTLARFVPKSDDEYLQWLKEIETWTLENTQTVWGNISNLPIELTFAKEVPFNRIKSVRIK